MSEMVSTLVTKTTAMKEAYIVDPALLITVFTLGFIAVLFAF